MRNLNSNYFRIAKFYLILIIKIFAYSIPIQYSIRRQLFGRNGRMDNFEYCKKIFKKHVIVNNKRNKMSSILEIGPGDSCYTIVFALKNKFKHITLIDKDTNEILRTLKKLEKMNFHIEKALDKFNPIKFKVKKGKKEIEVLILNNDFENKLDPIFNYYDLIFSNAVLQHMDKNQIKNLLDYCKRCSHKKSVHSHQIRFTDHISGKKQLFDHYHCPKLLWNSFLLKSFPFWTNRIYLDEYIKIFKSYGLIDINYENIKNKKVYENYHFILRKCETK